MTYFEEEKSEFQNMYSSYKQLLVAQRQFYKLVERQQTFKMQLPTSELEQDLKEQVITLQSCVRRLTEERERTR